MTLLVIVAAMSSVGRMRRLALGIAIPVVAVAGAHNWRRFNAAAAMVQDIGAEIAFSGAIFKAAAQCRS